MRRKLFLAVLALLLVTGCAPKQKLPRKLGELRPPPDGITTINITLNRSEYKTSVGLPNVLMRVRIIPLLKQGGQAGEIPEYRLFDIPSKSPYALLGLKNRDIVVAANDFIIYDPGKFRTFVGILHTQEGGNIEIRRGNQPLLLSYKFVE